MNDERTRRGPRRLLVLAVLIGAFVAALAAAPGASSGILTPDSTLNINLAGTGTGQVNYANNAGNPVTCQPVCSTVYTWLFVFPADTPELTAIAAAGSTFAGWDVNPATAIKSGCGLAITCEVNMGAGNPVTVTATFNAAPMTFQLAVLKAGSGQGTVTSTSAPAQPQQIDCGATCAAVYPAGTLVTLTAAPAASSTFAGWTGGGCAGTGPCVVTMNAAQTVTATFDTQTFPLAVTVSGEGGVSSTPEGILCPTTCTESFPASTVVTLTAQATPGWSFQGFSGACTGTSCQVTMNQAQNVSATFVQETVQASVLRRFVTFNGPPGRQRVINVRVSSDEEVSVRVRLSRGNKSVTRRFGNVDGTETLRVFAVRNRAKPGPVRVQVTFINDAGARKRVTGSVRLPAVR